MTVFISYSRTDANTADRLCELITANNLDVWIDRSNISGGSVWRNEIVDAIEDCSALVVLLSARSVSSANVIKEINIAESANRPIIPVEIEQVTITSDLRYQLSGVQIIPLNNFSEKFVQQIVDVLGGVAVTKPEPVKRDQVDISSMSGGGVISFFSNIRKTLRK